MPYIGPMGKESCQLQNFPHLESSMRLVNGMILLGEHKKRSGWEVYTILRYSGVKYQT